MVRLAFAGVIIVDNEEREVARRRIFVLINRMCAISVVINTDVDYLTRHWTYIFKRVKCKYIKKKRQRRGMVWWPVMHKTRITVSLLPALFEICVKRESSYGLPMPFAIRVLYKYATLRGSHVWCYNSSRSNNFVVIFINWVPVTASRIALHRLHIFNIAIHGECPVVLYICEYFYPLVLFFFNNATIPLNFIKHSFHNLYSFYRHIEFLIELYFHKNQNQYAYTHIYII